MRTIIATPPIDPARKIVDRVLIALVPFVPILFLLSYLGGR